LFLTFAGPRPNFAPAIAGPIVFAALSLSAPWMAAGQTRDKATASQAAKAEFAKLPLAFEANGNPSDSSAKFVARGAGYHIALTPEAAVLSLRTADAAGPRKGTPVLRMSFVGANRQASISAEEAFEGKSNYYIGSDPAKWRTGVSRFGRVRYRAIYPGVDLVYYGNQEQLEYDLAIAAGADASSIRMQVDGGDKLRLASTGDLIAGMGSGEVRLLKPVVYQGEGANRRQIGSHYELESGNRIRIELEAYDHAKPLVIDPVMVYATYIGGSGTDTANGLAVDAAGFAYITGQTLSSDFPVKAPNPNQSNYAGTAYGGNGDAYVVKIDPSKTGAASVVYATYLGGENFDQANSVAADASGNAYVAGFTNSSGFPVINAFQATPRGGADGFVSKLDARGQLVYSTYFGGGSDDDIFSLALCPDGTVAIAGVTSSPSWSPIPLSANAFQNLYGGAKDAFVAKLDVTKGTAGLVYGSYFGGQDTDGAAGIAVDTAGNLYAGGAITPVNGVSSTNTLPTTAGSFQPNSTTGGYDGWAAKFNPAAATGAASLVYATYLGGSATDAIYGVAADATGNAYVTGFTLSSDFPTTAGAYITAAGGSGQAFVTKLNPAGNALVYSTFLSPNPPSNNTYANAIAVDASGNAYVTGATDSGALFPQLNALPTYQNFGGFVTKLNAAGTGILFSTLTGGSSIAVDSLGNIYLAGSSGANSALQTAASSLAGAQTTFAGGASDGYFVRISLGASQMAQTISFAAIPDITLGAAPFTLTASATSGLAVTFASVTPTTCGVSGTTVTLLAAGGCAILASQTGSALYTAATPVLQGFAIAPVVPYPTPGPAISSSLTITSPAANSTVSGSITLSTSVSSLSGVASILYLLNGKTMWDYKAGELVPVSAAAPYTYTWSTANVWNGNMTVQAEALDASGNVLAVSAEVPFTIQNGSAVSRLVSPVRGQTLSGTVNWTAVTNYNLNLAFFSVDGITVHQQGWNPGENPQVAASSSYQLDTTQFLNGEHELMVGIHGGPNNYGLAMSQIMVNFNNGRTLMELRPRFKDVYLVPGESVNLAPSLLYTNGDKTAATASYTSGSAGIATVDVNGNVTATGLGITTITLQAQGKTATARVIVNPAHNFPHFSKSGGILTQYTPGSSIFVRSLFSTDELAKGNTAMGPALTAAGVNAFEAQIPIPAEPVNTMPNTWQPNFDQGMGQILAAANQNNLSIVFQGDDIARFPDTILRLVYKEPWGPGALQYAFTKLRDSGRAISVEMVDETSGVWGPTPKPSVDWSTSCSVYGPGGTNSNPVAGPCVVPRQTFTQYMSDINQVANRTPISWPILWLNGPTVAANWMGDPTIADYGSIYWDVNEVVESYPKGASLPQLKNSGLDNAVIGWMPGLQLQRPFLLLTGITGPSYTKNGPGANFTPGQDTLANGGHWAASVSAQTMYAATVGMAGTRSYSYDFSGWQQARIQEPVGITGLQTGTDAFGEAPSRWAALSTSFNFVKQLEPLILQPMTHAVSLGSTVASGAHKGPAGTIFIAVNFNEMAQTVSPDLTAYATSGTMTRYRLLGSSLTSSTVPFSATDSETLAPGESMIWVFPPAPQLTLLTSSQVAVTSSGLAYSRVTQTYNGTVTIKNIGSSAISGPLQVTFPGLPASVTVNQPTATISGVAYLTVPVSSLAAGQSVTVNVQFKNPSNLAISVTPAIYSGALGT